MRSSCCIFALLLASAYAQLVLNWMSVENATDRGAVCNDGSPAGYYFAPGSGSGANTWVIHQMGGWWCWDSPTCMSRAQNSPTLVSTKTYPPTAVIGGIFSNDSQANPIFYNANLIYIGYCSSDAWSGNHTGTGNFSDISGWHFKGKVIIQSVIEDLIAKGMNSTSSEILLTGCSAGGNGVFVNVDFVRSLLPMTPNKYLGFSDAGWISDYNIKETPFLAQYQLGQVIWAGVPNAICMYANMQASYFCYFGAVSQPYTYTPVLTHIEQYDIVQYSIDCQCTFNATDATQMQLIELLRVSIYASILSVKPPHSVYSPACTYHCSSLDNTMNTFTVGGISLNMQLAKFWESNGNVPNVIDTCTSIDCSGGCPSP